MRRKTKKHKNGTEQTSDVGEDDFMSGISELRSISKIADENGVVNTLKDINLIYTDNNNDNLIQSYNHSDVTIQNDNVTDNATNNTSVHSIEFDDNATGESLFEDLSAFIHGSHDGTDSTNHLSCSTDLSTHSTTSFSFLKNLENFEKYLLSTSSTARTGDYTKKV
ncbi:hypothetical protein TKK_0010244 [Trichogramma kaykai]